MSKKIMILGGDGYLGWSIALSHAYYTDDQIIIVDNYQKQVWQKIARVSELYPVRNLYDRIQKYKLLTGKNNLSFINIDVTEFKSFEEIFLQNMPDVIINAAQQPSAPFSMMNPDTADMTLYNNSKSCLNTLWLAHKYNPEMQIIMVGSAGSYSSIDADFIPKEKKNLYFRDDSVSHEIRNSWLPMLASDFYHQSKVQTFGLTDLCVNLWDLNVVTVQQSTIFGHCVIDELDDVDLQTRFNYDHIFGTVFNRFICQSVVGYPLTVYGDGTNTTGISCLCDATFVYRNLIEQGPRSGHLVEHNFTHQMKIIDIAKILDCNIQFIENPRKESQLSNVKKFDLGSYNDYSIQIEKTVVQTLEFVNRFKHQINTSYFNPDVKWVHEFAKKDKQIS